VPPITPNLRDLGGLRTVDGHTLAPHRVLRSAVPSADDVAPGSITWPPAVVIDLRSPAESEPVHPLTGSGARVVNLPLLSALRPGVRAQDLAELYLLVLEHAAHHLVELVREVGAASGPTLVHCAAGKDRTGVSIALLLRLVGVPREAVLADYLRTADAEAEITARLSRSVGSEHRQTLPASFFDVSAAALDAVLDVWDGHRDGVVGWFHGAGGTPEHVALLRRTLVS
jgi:protein-tyrosine phosphatase